MWIPGYIACIVIAIILIIKDWKDINEFLDECVSADEDKAFMIFMMIALAPALVLIYIIIGCVSLYWYVIKHRANKKIDINKQLNKLPKLMAEYDRLLRKPEVKLTTEYDRLLRNRVERVKLRNWDEN